MSPRKNLISSGDMRSIYCMHEKRALDSYFHGWEMHRISFDYKTYSLESSSRLYIQPILLAFLFCIARISYPMFGHFPFICRSECVTYQSLLKLFSHFHAFKGFGTNMKICFDFKIKVELKNHLRRKGEIPLLKLDTQAERWNPERNCPPWLFLISSSKMGFGNHLGQKVW